MTTAPAEQADLPPFTNMRARCARCGNRRLIRVHFDRDCADARGDRPLLQHLHRRLVREQPRYGRAAGW